MYVKKLKESNLPVKENKNCLLTAILNRQKDCIPCLIDEGLSPYEVIDYNCLNMNTFDCIDWKQKLIRMGSI